MSNLDNSELFEQCRDEANRDMDQRTFRSLHMNDPTPQQLRLRDVGINLRRNKMAWAELDLRAEARGTHDFALQYLIAMAELGIQHLAGEPVPDPLYIINFAPAIGPSELVPCNVLNFGLIVRRPNLGHGFLKFVSALRPYWTISVDHARISYDMLGFVDGMGQRCSTEPLHLRKGRTTTPHLRQIELD